MWIQRLLIQENKGKLFVSAGQPFRSHLGKLFKVEETCIGRCYIFHRSDSRHYLIWKITSPLKKTVKQCSLTWAFFTPLNAALSSSVFHIIKIILEKQICYLKFSLISLFKVLKKLDSIFAFIGLAFPHILNRRNEIALGKLTMLHQFDD